MDRLVLAFKRWLVSLWLKVRKEKEDDRGAIVSVGEWWQQVRRIAVCWPCEGVDFQAAMLVLDRIRDRFPNAHISIIALPGVGASVPSDLDVEIVKVQKNQLNLLGLPNRKFRDFLRSREYDTFLDLSPYYDPISAYYSTVINADLRIGFGGGWSEKVYNYVIIPRGEKKGVERYRVLARYIG
mgnify:CR=1 FL=1